jgi:hypothetical protein
MVDEFHPGFDEEESSAVPMPPSINTLAVVHNSNEASDKAFAANATMPQRSTSTSSSGSLTPLKQTSTVPASPPTKKKRKSPAVPWKKPKDMPKRPLSAYNLFFQEERNRLINSDKAGVGFENMAKTIAAKWRSLDVDAKAPYEEKATVNKQQYHVAVAQWRTKQKEKKQQGVEGNLPGRHSSFQENFEPLYFAPTPERSTSSLLDEYPLEWFETSESSEMTDDASQYGHHAMMAVENSTLHLPQAPNIWNDDSVAANSRMMVPPSRGHAAMGISRPRLSHEPMQLTGAPIRETSTVMPTVMWRPRFSHDTPLSPTARRPPPRHASTGSPTESITAYVPPELRGIARRWSSPSESASLEILKRDLDDDTIAFISSLKFD